MPSKRYTIAIENPSRGRTRRVSVPLGALIGFPLLLVTVPVLFGLGVRWSARAELDHYRALNARLRVENESYRAMTGELTTQVSSLMAVVDDLGVRASLGPDAQRALDRLPAVVKSRALGGSATDRQAARTLMTAFSTPEDTFGVLRNLLGTIETQLRSVRGNVERREALASAAPSIWPALGWLSAGFGNRRDPFTDALAFHAGLDISADRGQPVYATANGIVESAGRAGDYGNLVVVRHEFGLTTRYAHLLRTAVKPGQQVSRGDILGYVGSTGRSTGSHLHYEVWVNGRPINPLNLLTR